MEGLNGVTVNENGSTAATISDLNQKIDALTEQVAFLSQEAQLQRRRRQEWDELKGDLTLIAGDAYNLTVRQLDEVEGYVQLEDIMHLAKRMLRNTRNLEQMVDQLESLAELGRDLSPLSQNAFLNLMNQLDGLERKGYFDFARAASSIADRIVTSFSEDDVRHLGDNIVLILETVKEMTQPDVMRLLRRTATVVREEEPPSVSLLSILRQLNDPAVKKGLAKSLRVLKSVSEDAPEMTGSQK